MMFRLSLICLLTALLFSCTEQKEISKPNIIFILADDLGYGELGFLGQEYIKTPNIDALASKGMLFSDHYSGAPVCAPARCILMSGQHAGHAEIRGNDEWGQRGPVWDYEKVFKDSSLEGQRPVSDTFMTVAAYLKESGYATGVFGKWGLGAPGTIGVPNEQGFDRFFGYNCQRQAHNLYPAHLWSDKEKVYLDNALVDPKTKLDSLADIYDPESYALFTQNIYGPDTIHQEALKFLDEHKEESFFMYYASPLPHLPLQAPAEEVEKYNSVFGEEEPYTGDKAYFPCRYPKATYAAMISILDQQVGEIVEALEEAGIADNTVIFFSSDNGPTYLGGVEFEFFESSAPFANGYGRTKGFVHEGGIRVPLIAYWPGKIEGGKVSDHPSAFYDFLPTACELAGLPKPDHVDGISMLSSLMGEEQEAHDYIYWEFPSYNGQQALRMGRWKAVRKDLKEGKMDIALFDLTKDTLEANDLASEYPELIDSIQRIMRAEHIPAVNERFMIEALGDK